MNPSGNDTRRHARVQLPVTAEISCVPLHCFRQLAHLRDISAGGAFVYAQVEPSIGTVMKLEFTVQIVGGEIQIACEGPVVRVEQRALGEQSGVAIQFSQLNFGSW